MLERACLAGVMADEFFFMGSQNADVNFENATTSTSHSSGHNMELRLLLDAAPPAPMCMVCGKGMALESAPCSGSRSW